MDLVPPEIVMKITDYLDYIDVAHLGMTCAYLSKVCNDDFVWRHQTLRYIRNEIGALANVLVDGGANASWKDAMIKSIDFCVDTCTSTLPCEQRPRYRQFDMSWGPTHGGYWHEITDPTAIGGRAMELRRMLWFFSARADRFVRRAGTYTLIWRMRFNNSAALSDLRFSVKCRDASDVLAVGPLPIEAQVAASDRHRLRWAHFFMSDITVPTDNVFVEIALTETQSIKSGHVIDKVLFLPSEIMRDFTELVVPLSTTTPTPNGSVPFFLA